MPIKILKSTEDASVNFVLSGDYPGYFEARYVRRPPLKSGDPEYFACYLSSQSGCKQACRMCHLTNTKQTQAENATLEIFLEQAEIVLKHYNENCAPAKIVHFNFMARGEALSNEFFIRDNQELFYKLGLESI